MAAAMAASLNPDQDTDATHLGGVEQAASEAETEELMLLIAQNESKQMEKDRTQKERAIKREAEQQERRNKVYDDIVFDSHAIGQIHPKLHSVKVERFDLNDCQYLDINDIKYDGEFFLTKDTTYEDEEDR